MKKLFTILFLLITTSVLAAPPSRVSTYVSGDTILASEVTANEDAIFNYLQGGVDTYVDASIIGADISSVANIQANSINFGSIAQAVGITSAGSLTNSGATTLNGAVTIGDAIGDTLTIDAGAWTLTNAITITGTFANAGSMTTVDINGGTLDGVNVGGTTATGELIINNATDGADGLGSQGTSGQYLASAGAGANPTWSVPSGLSNVIFQYVAAIDVNTNSKGETQGATLTGVDSQSYRYLTQAGTSYTTVVSSKWIKIAGVSTATIYAQLWADGVNVTPSIQVNIGGQTGTSDGTTSETTPTWKNFTIDVSGLSNGTAYDVLIQLKGTGGNAVAHIGNVVIFGS